MLSLHDFPSGMALAPFNVLVSGKIRSDAEEAQRRETGNYRKVFPNWERTEQERKVAAALEKVAREVGTKHITAGLYSQILSLRGTVLTIPDIKWRLHMSCRRLPLCSQLSGVERWST